MVIAHLNEKRRLFHMGGDFEKATGIGQTVNAEVAPSGASGRCSRARPISRCAWILPPWCCEQKSNVSSCSWTNEYFFSCSESCTLIPLFSYDRTRPRAFFKTSLRPGCAVRSISAPRRRSSARDSKTRYSASGSTLRASFSRLSSPQQRTPGQTLRSGQRSQVLQTADRPASAGARAWM